MADRTVVYRLQADIGNLRGQLAAAGSSFKKLGDDATAATKSGEKFRRGFDQLGGAAGKVGLVAAAGLGAAVVKAANFDQAMSSVQAATHESAAAMDDLRAAALKAGADTAFSATEAAAGIENLAKAGVSTSDILDGGLSGALDLAAAGSMEVADAAEAAAGAMAQFGLSGDQVPHIADLMAAAAGKAQGEVSDFVMALKQGGTVAAQTGLSLEETTGALAAMAEQSLLGSDAGTSFKTMLSSLTPNSEKAADAMAAYNINAFDAQGNFVGMTELAGQLRAGLGDLTDEQRAMALETIFGSDAVRAASIIYDNGAEGIANWTAKVNDAGFAAETASIKQDNLRGDLEKLGGALETALIGTGSGSQGPLRTLTQSLTSVVDAYTELPQGAQTAAGAILATGAAVGGSVWVGSKLVRGIADTREAMEGLGITGPKAAKAMRAVAGAAAGLAVLTAAAAAVRALQEATDESLPGMETLESRLIDLANMPSGFSANIGKEFDSIGESIDRIADPGRMTALSDSLQTPFEGAFGEASSLRQARAEIDALDEALAELVSGGNADIAADALATLADQYGLSKGQVEALEGEMDAYGEALAGQENDAQLAAAAQADLESATNGVADSMSNATQETESFKDMLDRLNGELAGRSDMRDYQAAIDDFTASIKKNGNTFDINTEKGRENQAALDGIAGSALAVAENLDGAARKKFLTNAIDDIRTMGKQMGVPQREIRALIDLLVEANNHDVKPKVDVDPAAAQAKVETLKARLEKLNAMKPSPKVDAQTAAAEAKLNNLLAMLREAERDRSSTVTTVFRRINTGDTQMGPRNKAEGGYIQGPGTATSDSIPSYLSNGEYVIKAAAVDKYGVHMFDRLNAMHFADGGEVKKGDDKKPRRKWHGGEFVSDSTASLQRSIDRLTLVQEDQAGAVENQTRVYEEATEETKRWAEKMSEVAQATTAGFNTGLFDKDSNVWAAGAGGGPMANLQRDIAGLQERDALQSQLAGMGISGDALAAMLAEGSNADLTALIQSGQAQSVAALFSQRAALQGSVGAAAGQYAYGVEMRESLKIQEVQRRELERQTAQLQTLSTQILHLQHAMDIAPEATGEAVGARINGAAASGQRNRANGGPR